MSDKQEARCPGPVSRRNFLQAGTLSLGGLSLGDLFRLRAAAAKQARKPEPDTSVILIWLRGGPSQLETFDLKPEAPVEYRGEFQPISTVVPGMDICEYLPMHAKVADRFNLIRSISHKFDNHAAGAGRFLSGRNPLRKLDPVGQFPTVGPIVAKMREQRRIGLPNYVADSKRLYGCGTSYLGKSYQPFVVGQDPNTPNFRVPNISLLPQLKGRLDDRLRLLKSLDNFPREADITGSMQAMDEFNQQAINLLTSNKARDAFDLSKEDPKLRDRYGRHQWGQRALLARRLVEAGCSFVTMQLQHPRLPDTIGNWDIHAINGHLFKDMRGRLPIYDRAISALIEDIYARGLDKRVLVIVSGEFGRTPKIANRPDSRTHVVQPGRGHWAAAMSVLVSGGGMKTGQVIGSTNSKAEHPKDRPLDPNDLLATVYRHLGINYEHAFLDHTGRPMPILPFGKPIAELL